MRLTSKGRYAVRAILDLTSYSKGNPVRLQEISTRQTISLHYLEQLFRKLRNGQVVKSVRGPGGGYVLARSMDQITIKDILDCVGENINPAKDIIGVEAETSGTIEFQLSKDYFQNLGVIMQEYLSTTSLGDLMRKAKELNLENIIVEKKVSLTEMTQTEISTVNTTIDTTIGTTNENTTDMLSAIRGPIGEINQ